MSITPTEDQVAAFAQVALHNAESSNVAGYKLTLRLLDETEYEQFSGITKRKKGKAGGRYRGYFLHLDKNLCIQADLIFLGWTMSNTAGGKLRFEMESVNTFDHFRSLPAGEEWSLTLVEIDDEEKPVDQKQREAVETVKGGPRSQRAGALCSDPDFQRFVAKQTGIDKLRGPGSVKARPDECAEFIREKCRINSRAMLDHDPAAWERFTRWVSKPFAIWSNQ